MKHAGVITMLLSILGPTVWAQGTKQEPVVESLRKMLEQQNRAITLMQQIMEMRLSKVEAEGTLCSHDGRGSC